MNPYEPPESNPTPEDTASQSTAIWPLLLMNFAFLLCAILIVVLPSLGVWLFVSVLVIFSVCGWALAKSLREP